jgi:hypothetical protein
MPRVDAAVKNAIRNKYAWPGGYPLYLLTADGCALCVECGRKEFKQIAYAAHHDIKRDDWKIEAACVNWEDPDLYCDHCNEKIESAYAS